MDPYVGVTGPSLPPGRLGAIAARLTSPTISIVIYERHFVKSLVGQSILKADMKLKN